MDMNDWLWSNSGRLFPLPSFRLVCCQGQSWRSNNNCPMTKATGPKTSPNAVTPMELCEARWFLTTGGFRGTRIEAISR
jgi:hypothetical protein